MANLDRVMMKAGRMAPDFAQPWLHLAPDVVYRPLMAASRYWHTPNGDAVTWRWRRVVELMAASESRLARRRLRREIARLLALLPNNPHDPARKFLTEDFDIDRGATNARVMRYLLSQRSRTTTRIVSDRYRCIWLGVPKVASSSIESAIRSIDPDVPDFVVLPLDEFTHRYRQQVSDYFTFGFMRNPVDRLWSCFNDKIKRDGGEVGPMKTALVPELMGLRCDMSFTDFLELLCSPLAADDFSDEHWRSQHQHLTLPGRGTADYIGHFENLDNDWQEVMATIGAPHQKLPHRNAGPRQESGRQVPALDDALRLRVMQRFSGDYQLGHYCEPESVDKQERVHVERNGVTGNAISR